MLRIYFVIKDTFSFSRKSYSLSLLASAHLTHCAWNVHALLLFLACSYWFIRKQFRGWMTSESVWMLSLLPILITRITNIPDCHITQDRAHFINICILKVPGTLIDIQ